MKGIFGFCTLLFFSFACLRKILFNQILFIKSSTFFYDIFFQDYIQQTEFLYIFALLIFLLNFSCLFVKKFKQVFNLNYFVVFIFLFLIVFCLNYLFFEIPEDVSQNKELQFNLFNFNGDNIADTLIIFMTLLDKYDICLDITKEVVGTPKQQFQVILLGYGNIFFSYSILGVLSYILFYQTKHLDDT